MRYPRYVSVLCLFAAAEYAPAHASPPKNVPRAPVTAVAQSSQATAAGRIRQFAFDGDDDSYFESSQPPGKDDHFTLLLDAPVAAKSIGVSTGRPDGGDRLAFGILEVSADGKMFEKLADFVDGAALSKRETGLIRAIRIRLPREQQQPLVIREIAIDSEPAVASFQFPVEFTVDTADAPDMREWADNVARICERAWPMINEELKSEGFRPAHCVTISLKSDYRGVAATSGDRIKGSVKFFKEHPDDVGAMIHESVHVVQHYRGRGLPGWLVEGIADYVRFFKFEPGNLGPIDPDQAHYDGSYRVTASFLAYLTRAYDEHLVLKLNQRLRAGEYKPELFEELTGKSLTALDREWRAMLKR